MFGKTFTTTSWIYKLLAWPNDWISDRNLPQTICELRGRVLGKIAILLAAVAAIFIYVSTVASYLLYVVTCKLPNATSCMYGLNSYAKVGGVVLTFTGILFSLAAITYLAVKASDIYHCWRYNRSREGKKFLSDDNPAVLMFNSFVDKVCYPVKFTDDKATPVSTSTAETA